MADILESSSSDEAVFKKKLKKLEKYQGHGTELISVYIPYGTDRGAVMSQLTGELGQSANIKSPSTRKNVGGALRKITGFLKQIDFKLPHNGLVVFSGNVSETEGRTDIRLFTVRPIKDLRTRLYWCDSRFHLEPLREMLKPTSIYGLLAIDKSEATIANLIGKRYEIMGKFTSGISGKSRAGGQSSVRFQRLREEAEQDFYKRISEKCNMVFLPYGDKFAGLIVGGPGMTKQFFLEKDLLDHRIKKNLLGVVDTSYTDEGGIREIVQKSETLLKDTDIMKERAVVNAFFTELAKDGLATYGEKQVLEALERGQVSKLLVSEAIEWLVFRMANEQTGETLDVMDKDGAFDTNSKPGFEVLEEMDFLDYMTEKAAEKSTELIVVSKESEEGEQFYSGFGGLGAMLRYRI